jgi:DHA2 family multidrug resistance protein-like MFS transporter
MIHSAPKGTRPAALETLTGAVTTARPGDHAGAVLDAAFAAYTSGLTTSALVGATLSVAMAAMAAIALRNR